MQEKKIKGIKRHFLVDVLGLILFVVVHAANIQERAGAKFVLVKAAESGLPRLETILADDGYSGRPMVEYVKQQYDWRFVSVKRTELHTFKVIPKRWIVERTIGWMNNFRGLSKRYDYDSRTAEAKIMLASIFYMTKRLTASPDEPMRSLENDEKIRKQLETIYQTT
ncbi:MAG: transposase [Planctomycetaceae bacterium]|jgi:putative transposase|nr:transposase [Planctomycetaceae bacterium]